MKAKYAERVILTLKRLLFRYFTKNRTHRCIDKLQDFVNSYNSTPHSSLAYKAPKEVNDNNESDLWAYTAGKPATQESSLDVFCHVIFDVNIDVMDVRGRPQEFVAL